MLLPLTILVRESAGDKPTEKHIGLDPESIARVEDGVDPGTVHLYADGMDHPYTLRGTVEEVVYAVNAFLFGEEEDEPCEPATTATT